MQGVEEPAMEGNNGEVSLLDGQDAINPCTPLEPKQSDNLAMPIRQKAIV